MNTFPIFRFFGLLLLGLTLAGCAGKRGPLPGEYQGPPCLDALTLPQDLAVYADRAGGDTLLLSPDEQTLAAARQKERIFSPWTRSGPSAWVKESLAADFNMKPGNAFTENHKPFPADLWKVLVNNSNKEAYGQGAGPAITLRHTNLRAMPTAGRFYLKPDQPGEGYPFDYFQHTSLPPGTPLYVCNISRDGQWLLAESALTAGWLPAADAVFVDESFMTRWQSRPLAALIRENVPLSDARGHIGTLLPMAGEDAYAVWVPRRDTKGQAVISTVLLGPEDAAAVPMPLSPANFARIGNHMMGQAYGWGGLDEKRDCSALTRDAFAPFGIFLPRNSAQQAKMGRGIPLKGFSLDEKKTAIAEKAVPFLSLVWMRGHVGVYLGEYEGRAVMFHNIWGLRTKSAKGTSAAEGRAVVGKAVVTTLQPGLERPDLASPGSLLDRIERVAVLKKESDTLASLEKKTGPPPKRQVRKKKAI